MDLAQNQEELEETWVDGKTIVIESYPNADEKVEKFFTSATNGQGVRELFAFIESLDNSLKKSGTLQKAGNLSCCN